MKDLRFKHVSKQLRAQQNANKSEVLNRIGRSLKFFSRFSVTSSSALWLLPTADILLLLMLCFEQRKGFGEAADVLRLYAYALDGLGITADTAYTKFGDSILKTLRDDLPSSPMAIVLQARRNSAHKILSRQRRVSLPQSHIVPRPAILLPSHTVAASDEAMDFCQHHSIADSFPAAIIDILGSIGGTKDCFLMLLLGFADAAVLEIDNALNIDITKDNDGPPRLRVPKMDEQVQCFWTSMGRVLDSFEERSSSEEFVQNIRGILEERRLSYVVFGYPFALYESRQRSNSPGRRLCR